MALTYAFGGDTGETPESVKRKRAIAEALLMSQGTPDTIGEGLQALGHGIVANVMGRRADKAEREGRAGAASAFGPILAALGGGEFPSAPAAPGGGGSAAGPSASAPNPNVGSTIDFARAGPESYRNAIASIESAGSGGYSAVGPTHPKMGRALGRYQVMEANIGPWTEKHLGTRLTPEEFLANPRAQDAVFDAEFGSYVKKFGPEGAAQAWFAGEGGVGKTDRKDSLGTSVGQYGKKFTKALGGGTQVASLDPSIGLPDDLTAAVTEQGLPADHPSLAALAKMGDEEQAGVSFTPPQQTPQPRRQVAQALTEERSPMSGQSNLPSLGTLLGAAQQPFINPNQAAIIEALTGQRLKEMDPTTQLERRKMELELRNLENPPVDPADVLAREKFQFEKEQAGRMTPADEARIDLEREKFEADQKKLMELGAGTTVFDPATRQPVFTSPKEETKPSAVQEYEYAKEQGFPGTFQDWEASKKGGMSLQVDPATGAVSFQQGGNIKPMTEGQSKDAVFSTRAEGALPLIDQYGDALTNLGESVGGRAPVVGNYLKSPEFQMAEQAGKEFLQAILRKDTGAAITAEETAEYGSVYLPQPGNSPELLAQKKASRIRALEAIKAGMPPQAILAQEKALEKSGQPTPEAPKEEQSFTSDKDVFDAIQSGKLKVGDVIILNGKRMRLDP